MDSTSPDTSAPERLRNTLPSQAQELLRIEQRERERLEHERKSLHAREVALEQELASARKQEEETNLTQEKEELQQFKNHDLRNLLATEHRDTETRVESLKRTGEKGVKAASQSLARTALSNDFLSSL